MTFEHIKLVISDMDGVHTNYDEAFAARAYRASAACANILLPDMPYENAYEIALDSRKRTHVPYQVFIDDYGIDEEKLMDVFQVVMDLSHMQPDHALQQVMHDAKVDHALLTKASDYWMRRVVKQMALSEFYNEKNIITQENFPGTSKARSSEPYVITLDTVAHKAEDALMIEDTQKNLKFAKEIGLTTVWVRPRPDEEKQPYTDYVFEQPIDFWKEFVQARKRHPRVEN